MVFSALMDFVKARLFLPLVALGLLCALQASADVWTGRVQNILGPLSQCSVPPREAGQFGELRVASEFTHVVCKEFVTLDTNQYRFQLSTTSESEYILLIAQEGQQFVSTADYRRGAESVLSNCNQKHFAILQNSIPVSESWCAGQTLPR